MHLLRTLLNSKEVSRSTATKVESGISDANRRSLVRERRVKKDRMLVEKNPDRVCFKGQLNTLCSGWRNKKKQGSCSGILSRGNHCQSKPKEGKVEVRDLRGILVGSSRAQSQAVGRSIYIYVYIIGSAEALPILCVRYIRWEREIQRERERERRKWRHHYRAKIGDEFCTSPCQKCAP